LVKAVELESCNVGLNQYSYVGLIRWLIRHRRSLWITTVFVQGAYPDNCILFMWIWYELRRAIKAWKRKDITPGFGIDLDWQFFRCWCLRRLAEHFLERGFLALPVLCDLSFFRNLFPFFTATRHKIIILPSWVQLVSCVGTVRGLSWPLMRIFELRGYEFRLFPLRFLESSLG
jgi:hypothetical protein